MAGMSGHAKVAYTLLGVFAVAGLLSLVFTNPTIAGYFGNHTQSVGGGSSSSSGGSTTTGYANTSTVCPTSGFTAIQYLASYNDPTNNYKQTFAAVAANVLVGTTVVGASQTVGGSGGYNSITSTVPCGTSGVSVIFGDSASTSYYSQQSAISTARGAALVISDLNLQKGAAIGTGGLTVSNGTAFLQTNGVTVGQNGAAGSTYSNLKLNILTGSGQYGATGVCITFVGNSVALQKVYIPGAAVAPATCYSSSSSSNVPVGSTTWQYLVQPFTNWTTTYTFPVVIQTSSAYASNVPVNVIVNDQEPFLQSGVLTNAFLNPNTQADLGQSEVSLPGDGNKGGPAFAVCQTIRTTTNNAFCNA